MSKKIPFSTFSKSVKSTGAFSRFSTTTRFPPTTAASTTSTTLWTPENPAASIDFLTLTQTIVRHLFSAKGYANEQEWADHVNYTQIRDRCFFSATTFSATSATEQPDNIECTVQEAGAALSQFIHGENVYYFYIYIALALFLITIAIVFNVVAIVAVGRLREKYPRHHVFISLSISDLLLTTTLLLKRCGDQEDVLDEATRDFLSNNVAVLFQIGYIMSALGLLCLSLDNVLAIAAPYFYESLSRPLSTRLLICCLWTAVISFAIIIRLCNLHTNLGIQMAVCVGMLVLLVGILCSYIFACAQSHVHRRRLAVMTDDRRVTDVRNQLRGFLTTGLLVFWCLICWSPLVGYLLTDDDTLSSAYRFFTRYLIIALLVLHFNAVVDPVIYCLRIRDIRKSLFRTLGIKRGRQQSILQSARYSSAAQFTSSQHGSSRKSAPSFMHSDSYRRSYIVENGDEKGAEKVSGSGATNIRRPLMPQQNLTAIEDEHEMPQAEDVPLSNGTSVLPIKPAMAVSPAYKGRQQRAYSAIAIPIPISGFSPDECDADSSLLKAATSAFSNIQRLRQFQAKNNQRTVKSLCDGESDVDEHNNSSEQHNVDENSCDGDQRKTLAMVIQNTNNRKPPRASGQNGKIITDI